MDSNTFLEGGMKLSVTVGGEAPEAVGADDAACRRAGGSGRRLTQAVQTLSARDCTQQLDEKTKQAIGLMGDHQRRKTDEFEKQSDFSASG